MKSPLMMFSFIALCIAFGVLALCQDKIFAVAFAICCIGLMAVNELGSKK